MEPRWLLAQRLVPSSGSTAMPVITWLPAPPLCCDHVAPPSIDLNRYWLMPAYTTLGLLGDSASTSMLSVPSKFDELVAAKLTPALVDFQTLVNPA